MIEEAHKKYGFMADYIFNGVNDPDYKDFLLGMAMQDAYGFRSGSHIMVDNIRRQVERNLIAPNYYADNPNTPELEYKKARGYDNPLTDVVRLYETILTLYDMAYKMRGYQGSSANQSAQGNSGENVNKTLVDLVKSQPGYQN